MNSLEITTMIGCPLMCSICPQDLLKSKYAGPKYMSFDDFVYMLSSVPKDVKIIFSGYAEPWSNPEMTNFLSYALENGYVVDIYTTLYGMKDPEKVLKLINNYKSQVNDIWLHLPDNNNMPGYKPSDEYDKALKLFLTLSPNIMTMDTNAQPHSSLDKFDLKPYPWIYHTRAENVVPVESIGLQRPTEMEFVVECLKHQELKANVLLPNGDVTLCCMDYGLRHVIGNLKKQTYREIVYSDTLKNIYNKNHTIRDTSTLCRSCVETHHKTPWNDEEIFKEVVKLNPDFKL